jgi:hypothetical protein
VLNDRESATYRPGLTRSEIAEALYGHPFVGRINKPALGLRTRRIRITIDGTNPSLANLGPIEKWAAGDFSRSLFVATLNREDHLRSGEA